MFAIVFPTSLDSLTNPLSTDTLASPAHHTQHADANDAIEALEAKIGINGSAVTTSHDYKLSGVTGSDKAVSKTGTETLTNKTLTAPAINMGSDANGDMYYRTGGAFARLAIGISGYILSASSGGLPEWIANPAAADASTTAKGVVEEATLAEVLARTAAGAVARLFVNPASLPNVMTYDYAASAAGSDTYAITPSGTAAPTAYVTGQKFHFKADVANTGAGTLNVNSLGAKALKKYTPAGKVDIETGDILINQFVSVEYDGTDMVVFSRLASESGTYASGVFTKDIADASVAQTIAHGLGRTPRFIRMTHLTATGTSGVTGAGAYNGTTVSQVLWDHNGITKATDSTNIVSYLTGAESQKAVPTFDATNITLTWTKVGSPTGSIVVLWEAYA